MVARKFNTTSPSRVDIIVLVWKVYTRNASKKMKVQQQAYDLNIIVGNHCRIVLEQYRELTAISRGAHGGPRAPPKRQNSVCSFRCPYICRLRFAMLTFTEMGGIHFFRAIFKGHYFVICHPGWLNWRQISHVTVRWLCFKDEDFHFELIKIFKSWQIWYQMRATNFPRLLY